MRSLLCCLLLATTGTAMAQDVFKCVDAQGQTTYTLGACPAGSQVSVIPLQPSSSGFNMAPPPVNTPPATVAPQQNIIVIPEQRPANGITIVGGSSSSSSSSSSYSSSQRGAGIIYQPVPVYIERPPRHETWHMVPHPQAEQPQPPAPPPPPNRGIPIDR